jgi:predicted DNA-binding helix-hairpin-helix protein
MLDLDLDPKLAWALRNRHLYPLDLNTADRELLLRVPGLGPRSVDRILQARRNGLLRLDGVKRIARSIRKSLPFIQTIDYSPGGLTDSADLRARFAPPAQQLQLI